MPTSANIVVVPCKWTQQVTILLGPTMLGVVGQQCMGLERNVHILSCQYIWAEISLLFWTFLSGTCFPCGGGGAPPPPAYAPGIRVFLFGHVCLVFDFCTVFLFACVKFFTKFLNMSKFVARKTTRSCFSLSFQATLSPTSSH